MPLWKACNQQVDYLDRTHCNLIAVPDDILRYTKSLEELLLDFNQLRDLPKGLYKLVNLRKLSVSENEISRLSADIGSLVHLEELNVSQNDLQEIPETVKLCKNLAIVDFSSNPLQRLPEGLTQLSNLTRIALNNVSLTRLPADIGSLSSLEILELRDNCLKYLPASLCSLKNLRSLDLGNNTLEDLPETIGGLSSLEELLLDGNELGYLPKEIGSLKKLTQLDVSMNKLDRLPNEMSGLSSITDLLLSENHLEYLPEGIGQMKKLTILKADQNQILLLTSNIGSCHALQELILTENLLKELPSTIGKLKNLVILNADRNRLSQIPKEIGSCSRLGVLSLRDNQIELLPSETGNLKLLHVLDVSGNKLRSLPFSLGACNLKAIWLSENQAQPLLKFQQDVDPETGQKCLVCFLLPQQAANTQSSINLIKLDKSLEPVADNRESWNNETHNRQSAIRFKEEDMPLHEKESEGQFVRHNTPFPKDLRVRKPFGKDGHTEHGRRSTEVAGSPAHALGDTVDHKHGKVAVNGTTNGSGSPLKLVAAQPTQPAAPAGQQKVAGVTATPRHQPVSRVANNVHHSDDSGDNSDESVENKGPGRQVGFSGDLPTEPVSQLRRRDTPHYLKNKRVTDSEGNLEEKVKLILADRKSNDDTKLTDRKKDYVDSNQNHLSPTKKHINDDDDEDDEEQSSDDDESDIEEHEITIRFTRKIGVGLGISIAGGVGSTAYREDDEGIFLSRVTEDGPSYKAGLRQGDKLLSVNKESLTGADHHRAVAVLKDAGHDVTIVVLREVPVPRLQIISTVLQRGTVGLGFSIAGGKGATPYRDDGDESTYISKITEGGLAARDGKLKVGDHIIVINGVDVKNASHERVVALLRESGSRLQLTISRDPNYRTSLISNSSQQLDKLSLRNPENRNSLPNIDQTIMAASARGSQMSKAVSDRSLVNSSSKPPQSMYVSASVKKTESPQNTNWNNSSGSDLRKSIQPGTDSRTNAAPQVRGSAGQSNGKVRGLDEPIPHSDDVRLSFSSTSDKASPARSAGTARLGYYQPTLDDVIPHIDDDASDPYMSGMYQLPRDTDERIRRRYEDGSNLDYQIPHVEGRVGLGDGEAYLDPVEGRTIRHSQIVLPGDHDIDKPVPHADDQVHFVKQVVSRMDADIPNSEYQMNYMTNSAGRPIAHSGSRSQEFTQTFVQIQPGPVFEPPPMTIAKIQSSPIVMRKPTKPDSSSTTQVVGSARSSSMEKTPAARARAPSSQSVKNAVGSVKGIDNLNDSRSNVDELFRALEQGYDATPPVKGQSSRQSGVSIRSSSVPPRQQDSSVSLNNSGSLTKKQNYPIEKITVTKAGGPLGLSIVGGTDHVSHPFGISEPGIFVSKIVRNGAASRTTLRVGDRVLSVNGKDVRKSTHQDAVAALCAPTHEIILEVRRDPQPPGLKELHLTKLSNEKLGLSIRGGSGNPGGNPLDSSDDGIFISKIIANGAIARDGRLTTGLRLLEVNGHSLLGCSHHEAVEVLRSIQDHMTITVCEGFDPQILSAISSSPSLSGSFQQNGKFNSMSSLDLDNSSTLTKSKGRKHAAVLSSSDDESRPLYPKGNKPPIAAKPRKASASSTSSAFPDQSLGINGSFSIESDNSMVQSRSAKPRTTKPRSKQNLSTSSVAQSSEASGDDADQMLITNPTKKKSAGKKSVAARNNNMTTGDNSAMIFKKA